MTHHANIQQLLGILHDHFTSKEEGWLWFATFTDDAEGGVVQEIEGEYEDIDRTTDTLASIANSDLIDRTWLALCRAEGRPTESDREFWRALRGKVAGGSLVDMVVFNHSDVWSMREEDAAARDLSA